MIAGSTPVALIIVADLICSPAKKENGEAVFRSDEKRNNSPTTLTNEVVCIDIVNI